MITFSDLNFIFRFLPVFLLAFYITPVRFRTWTLLMGSLLFYAVGDLRMLPALLGAVIVNFFFSKALFTEKSRSLFIFILCIDAGMLVEFKILSQFVDSALMPIGISFYIFKMISFQVDVFKGKIRKEARFVDVASYFTMFPQILSGPIMRYEDYLADTALKEKRSLKTILGSIEDGLLFFVVGLSFKVILADHLAILWKEIGTIGYESISTSLAWLGAVTYSLELYFDFWGYSLMAAGIGVMLGFPFIRNFDHPYGAGSVSEFYRRWHATLGSWFRDYIYIPLGGSRKGSARTAMNLLIVWLITGFWHGTGLNFIIWGLILFVIIFCEKFFIMKKLPSSVSKVVGKINVLLLIPLTWVIFAIPDRTMLLQYFMRLFPFFGEGIAVNKNDFAKNMALYWMYLVPGICLLIPGVYDFWENNRKKPVFTIVLFLLFWACVFSLSNAAGNPFMYIRF
ncbi:MAG: MBOAT family protein [Butyrivibrio sp.]|nr:MBOAT family protein [Butyrivibrio sp.]